MEQLLRDKPEYRLLSKAKFLRVAVDEGGLSRAEAARFYDTQELGEMYQRKKGKNALKITAPPYSFQVDIIEMPAYRAVNGGVSKFLLAVDILSRKAFAYPLKSGTMAAVLDAFEKFYNDAEYPINSVAGDAFFDHRDFRDLISALGAQLYTDVAKDDHITRQGDKLGIIDRATRTIKRYIEKMMLQRDSTRWTRFLSQVIDLYNTSPHAAHPSYTTPADVYEDRDYLEGLYEAQRQHNRGVNLEFQPGDRVRLMNARTTFGKEGATYGAKVYTVEARVGNRFQLEGVRRLYRSTELVKAKASEGRVRERAKQTAEAAHKTTRATARALDVPYDEAGAALKEVAPTRPATRSRTAAGRVTTRSKAKV